LILLVVFQQTGHAEKRATMPNASLSPAHHLAARQGRRERQSQKAAQAVATVDALLTEAGGPLPAYALAHAARARMENTRSLIALKCLGCSCWEKTEVAACAVTSCPLYPLRPYRKRLD
jgi:hypothetical protein